MQPTGAQQTLAIGGPAIVEGAVCLSPRHLPVPPQDAAPQVDAQRRHRLPVRSGLLRTSSVSVGVSDKCSRSQRRRDTAGSDLPLEAWVTGVGVQRRTRSAGGQNLEVSVASRRIADSELKGTGIHRGFRQAAGAESGSADLFQPLVQHKEDPLMSAQLHCHRTAARQLILTSRVSVSGRALGV